MAGPLVGYRYLPEYRYQYRLAWGKMELGSSRQELVENGFESNVQISNAQCIVFDELASGLNYVAH